MAQTINVTGPHVINWGAGGSATTALGRGDNNDLFRIEVSHRYADIQTNEHGESPANSVIVGVNATVHFSLVQWDTAQAAALQAAIGGQGSGIKFPTVGRLMNNGITGDNTVSFSVVPDISGRIGVSVSRVRLVTFNVTDFGNRASRLVVSGDILPDGDAQNGTLFTLT